MYFKRTLTFELKKPIPFDLSCFEALVYVVHDESTWNNEEEKIHSLN